MSRRGRWRTACLAALAGLVIGTGTLLAQTGGTIAFVKKVKNDVRHRPTAAANWGKAALGDQLGDRQELRTGEQSFCALMFVDDQSILKIDANSEVTLRTTREAGGGLSKKLWVGVGGIYAEVTKQEGRQFQVETPTSVATVKGSRLYDLADATGASTVYPLEGTIEFSNPLGSILVEPGFKGFSDGVNPPVLSPAPPGEVPQFGREPVPGEKPQGEGGGTGQKGRKELRIGLQERDGTRRELILRYEEAR